jgi:putative Holliday junction resolvase
MGRLLALDYGTKRVGVAETDDLQIIASPLITIHSSEVITFITDYMTKHKVDAIIVGDPKKLNNEPTDTTQLINEFALHLSRKFPDVNIFRVDERFTSKMAAQSLIMGGASKKKRKEKLLIDAVSAAIILQSYMESNTYKKP